MITIYKCVNQVICYRVQLQPAPGPATGQAKLPTGGCPGREGGAHQVWSVKEGAPLSRGPAEISKTRSFPEKHLLCFEGWRDLEFWFPTNY